MDKPLVVVTGGCGYIGSHTIIELVNKGFEVASIDNFSRSRKTALQKIEEVTGKRIQNHEVDICNAAAVNTLIGNFENAVGVIHFAAYKSVPESVSHPEKYYYNNLFSLINVLNSCIRYGIGNVVFSSSCSVYGDIVTLPVSETTMLSGPKSPYATTKIMGETIMTDVCRAHRINAMCLRYFNPVGAHPSGLIGEMPLGAPDNLVPVITQTAVGKRPSMSVFGGQLPTRDGSCVRDYVHVMDIARAHVLAIQRLQQEKDFFETINLGTGTGVSVFEAIRTFESVSGQKLNYDIVAPRKGDVIEIYSDATKAKAILGWEAEYDINDMMTSAWKWELHLSATENHV